MLDGIKPLANNVLANLMQEYYPNWYTKCISVRYPDKVYIYIYFFFIYVYNFINFFYFFLKRLENFLMFSQCWH
jgi:hypothetical protein